MNKHHGDLLTKFVVAFTPIGIAQKKKNAFSGGSYKILSTELQSILTDSGDLELKVRIQIRGEDQVQEEIVTVPLGENKVFLSYFILLFFTSPNHN